MMSNGNHPSGETRPGGKPSFDGIPSGNYPWYAYLPPSCGFTRGQNDRHTGKGQCHNPYGHRNEEYGINARTPYSAQLADRWYGIPAVWDMTPDSDDRDDIGDL